MNKLIKYVLVLFLVAGISSGCENFLTPSVDQEKPTDGAIQSASDLQATVYGVLDDLNRVELYGRDYMVTLEAATDNAFSNGFSGRFIPHDRHSHTVNSGYAEGVWEVFYQAIAGTNVAINAELESNPQVDNVRGQAYGLRAFSHMNLLLAFGQQYISSGDQTQGVPYVTTYNEGELYPPRNTVSEVWSMIGDDLQTAAGLADPASFDVTTMNYWAIKGLQTRYYLFTEQYDQVISVAEEIINSGNFSITPASNYVSAWNSGSGPSSLFELAFTSTDRLGTDNIARIYKDTNYGDVEVTEDLYTSFDQGDVRLDLYTAQDDENSDADGVVDYRVVGKYVNELGSDNVRVIRYAEVILNYAEALARNGQTGPALVELTKITSNRNVAPYATGSVENVLEERRLELAMEGHRLYDLARTGTDIAPGDDGSYQGSVIPFGSFQYALPIPDAEVRANSNISQNEGYGG